MSRFGLLLVSFIFIIEATSVCSYKIKRSESTKIVDNSKEIAPEDNETFVVPKRAALLLDRLMVALHHALEDDESGKGRRINKVYKDKPTYVKTKIPTEHLIGNSHKLKPYISDEDFEDTPDDVIIKTIEDGNEKTQSDEVMDLQRRDHGDGLGVNKGRVYWRCYFNAVTCF